MSDFLNELNAIDSTPDDRVRQRHKQELEDSIRRTSGHIKAQIMNLAKDGKYEIKDGKRYILGYQRLWEKYSSLIRRTIKSKTGSGIFQNPGEIYWEDVALEFTDDLLLLTKGVEETLWRDGITVTGPYIVTGWNEVRPREEDVFLSTKLTFDNIYDKSPVRLIDDHRIEKKNKNFACVVVRFEVKY